MSVDAHRAFSSADCAVPNCPEEAEGTGAYCLYHREQRSAMLGLPMTRDDEHRPQEPEEREETKPMETCKVCGGELDEIGRTTTSPRHKGRCAGCRSEGQRRATAHLRKGTPQKASGEPSAEELGDALTEAERYLADLGVVE